MWGRLSRPWPAVASRSVDGFGSPAAPASLFWRSGPERGRVRRAPSPEAALAARIMQGTERDLRFFCDEAPRTASSTESLPFGGRRSVVAAGNATRRCGVRAAKTNCLARLSGGWAQDAGRLPPTFRLVQKAIFPIMASRSIT